MDFYFIRFPELLKKVVFFAMSAAVCSCGPDESWKLVWEEDFESKTLDSQVWSWSGQGPQSLTDTLANHTLCCGIRDGCLVIGAVEDGHACADVSQTDCLTTFGKKMFSPGRIEVRVRFRTAPDVLTSICLLPGLSENEEYGNARIEMMKHLGSDSFVYQSIRSCYTSVLGQKDNPVSCGVSCVESDDFNIYSVDILRDSIVFHVNGVRNFAYPRVNEIPDSLGQFPYFQPMHLLIDMQPVGAWAGETGPDYSLVEMEVDWVRHYIKETE